MEDKGIARDAIDSARRWLGSARANASAGSYDTALYSLEMSVEIALKGLLFSLCVEVPKTHSIGDFVADAIKENGHLPKRFEGEADKMVSTFNALIGLRSVSGYMFETKSTMKDLKEKYEEYENDAEKVVELCADGVDAICAKP
jgi:HEPN domain-containing protein